MQSGSIGSFDIFATTRLQFEHFITEGRFKVYAPRWRHCNIYSIETAEPQEQETWFLLLYRIQSDEQTRIDEPTVCLLERQVKLAVDYRRIELRREG